jgi:hypothetical protein
MTSNRKAHSEGVRRLSLAVGGGCVLAWIVFFLRTSLRDNVDLWQQQWSDWVAIVVVTFASFFFGWSVVRIIAWVWRGFTGDDAQAERPSE